MNEERRDERRRKKASGGIPAVYTRGAKTLLLNVTKTLPLAYRGDEISFWATLVVKLQKCVSFLTRCTLYSNGKTLRKQLTGDAATHSARWL